MCATGALDGRPVAWDRGRSQSERGTRWLAEAGIFSQNDAARVTRRYFGVQPEANCVATGGAGESSACCGVNLAGLMMGLVRLWFGWFGCSTGSACVGVVRLRFGCWALFGWFGWFGFGWFGLRRRGSATVRLL